MTNSGKIQGGSFYLADNIDLSAYKTGEGWTPIGTDANPFRGSFNGNGYVISNLYINTTASTSFIGLFGVGNRLSNVGIEAAYVYAPNTDRVGILTGKLLDNADVLVNCYSKGNVTGKNSVGGLVGGGMTIYCYSTANVTGNTNVGGLVGAGTTRECFSTGNVRGNTNVGGLMGSGDYAVHCYTTAKVTGNTNVGGLIGAINGGGPSDCYVLSRSDGLNGVFVGNDARVTNCYYSSYYIGKPLTGGSGQNVTNVQVYDGDVPFTYRPEYHPVQFDLQIGIHSGESSKLSVDTSFDIWKLDTLWNIGYMDSSVLLNTVDEIIDRVNERQSTLGAYQNRLESALDEISIQYENLVSSRSTIRDADIAEESSVYIRSRILQQAAATLLATANQTPAIALELL